MNNPNFENIDRWLFDYVEGNLSSKQESMLENYILNHPELEVDLDMWRMSNIKTSKAFVNDVRDESWQRIQESSGITQEKIREAAQIYCESNATIACDTSS